MRTGLLLVGCVVALAGCLSGAPGAVSGTNSPPGAPSPAAPGETATTATPGDDATGDETDRTDERATRAGGETTARACEEANVTTVDPLRESVTPGALPDRPETFNESSVASFVAAYEQTYRRNVGLEADTTAYEVSAWNASVRTVPDGYVVTVTAVYWYNAAEPTDRTATPTVIHADGPEYTASYYVTDDRMRRDTTIDGDPLSPRRGRTVECW